MNKKNNVGNYEPLVTLKLDRLFAEQFPIAYENKVQELIEDCGMSREEAIDAMKNMEVELELYYEKGRGFFAVESEVVECSPIYSPYTKKFIDEENMAMNKKGIIELFKTQPWYGEFEKEYNNPDNRKNFNDINDYLLSVLNPENFITSAFIFDETERGLNDWMEIDQEWRDILNKNNK